MTEFLPSALRHRLTLEELVSSPDEGGGVIKSWTAVAVLFADLRPTGGNERVEADRLSGTVTHEISLRYRAGIVPAMRFREGARVFEILAAIDIDERRRWLKCLCEEREL